MKRASTLVVVLLVLGLALSAFSLYHHTAITHGFQHAPSFCNVSARVNCDVVNASKWSTLFGQPLAAWGLMYYLALMVIVVGSGLSMESRARLVTLGGLLGSAFALYLFYVSEFLIGSLCLVCIGMYLVNFGLLFAGYVALPMTQRGIIGLARTPLSVASLVRELSGWGWVSLIPSLIIPFLIPGVLLALFKDTAHQHAPKELTVEEAFNSWKTGAVAPLAISTEGGAIDRDYAKGGEGGVPVEIVEFADFECHGCRLMYRLLEGVLAESHGKVRLVVKNFPLDRSCNAQLPFEMHHSACLAAEASRCLGEQGLFWEATDLLYALEPIDKGAPKEEVQGAIMELPERLNADGEAFTECLASDRHLPKIQSDIAEGIAAKIDGTPAIFINGRKVPRTSFERFKELLQKIIASES